MHLSQALWHAAAPHPRALPHVLQPPRPLRQVRPFPPHLQTHERTVALSFLSCLLAWRSCCPLLPLSLLPLCALHTFPRSLAGEHRFQSPTEEELSHDRTCIVCREDI